MSRSFLKYGAFIALVLVTIACGKKGNSKVFSQVPAPGTPSENYPENHVAGPASPIDGVWKSNCVGDEEDLVSSYNSYKITLTIAEGLIARETFYYHDIMCNIPITNSRNGVDYPYIHKQFFEFLIPESNGNEHTVDFYEIGTGYMLESNKITLTPGTPTKMKVSDDNLIELVKK